VLWWYRVRVGASSGALSERVFLFSVEEDKFFLNILGMVEEHKHKSDI